MKLTIEIVAAALLVCIATSAASAAGKIGKSATAWAALSPSHKARRRPRVVPR